MAAMTHRWMNCQGLWEPALAWLCVWDSSSSLSLLLSSCVWMFTSTLILLSESTTNIYGFYARYLLTPFMGYLATIASTKSSVIRKVVQAYMVHVQGRMCVESYVGTICWIKLLVSSSKFWEAVFLSFLVTIMSLMIPWSLTLAVVDVYFVLCKRPSRQPGIKSVIVIGDWVLSFLSLAAACSTASVTDVLITSRTLCVAKLCNRYQLSAAMAFLSWFLSLASSLFNLWLLPST